MTNWKATVGQKIRRLTAEECRAIVARISVEGPTIFHEDIRGLTGGYIGQSINFYVIRKLSDKAGITSLQRTSRG